MDDRTPTASASRDAPTLPIDAPEEVFARCRDLTGAALLDVLRADQSRRWRAGQAVPAEAYLQAFPDLPDEDALVLVGGEALLRSESGEAPALDEFQRRFPRFHDDLALQFDIQRQLAEPTLDGQSTPASHEPAPPSHVPGYGILGEVGRGGMGVVYKARDLTLNRIVALKMVLAGSHASPEQMLRFFAEAELAASLQHANIVQVFDVGAHQGHAYIAMEYVDGKTLAQRTGGVPQPPRHVAAWIEIVARAIHYAHTKGVVHRDLKPANVLVARGAEARLFKGDAASASFDQGLLKITDFGLAKQTTTGLGPTITGALLGTPAYMAPEQAEGKPREVGPAVDVWALGVMVYELATGRQPFVGDGPMAVMREVLKAEPQPPRRLRPSVPRDLETICLKCLRREPARRYESAAALADDLRRFLANEPIAARPVGSVERGWRWCLRNPGLAILSALVFLLVGTVAVVSTIASVRLSAALVESEKAREEAVRERVKADVRSWEATFNEARLRRVARQPGQRFETLRIIRELLKLPLPEGRTRDELRTEAIAALLLPDARYARAWDGWPSGTNNFAVDDELTRYARSDRFGHVEVRAVADDRLLYRLPGLALPVPYGGLQFSPDGRYLHVLVHTLFGYQPRLWRLDGPEPVPLLEDGHVACAFRPDSGACALYYRDGTIHLVDLPTGTKTKRFASGFVGGMPRLAWAPKRPVLAVRGDTTCKLLDLDAGRLIAEPSLAESIHWVDWHPDGHRLALASMRKVHVWGLDEKRFLGSPIEGFKYEGLTVRFDRTGDRLVANEWSGQWQILDARSGQALLGLPAGSWLARFSRDGQLGVGVAPPRMYVADYASGSEFRTLPHATAAGRGDYAAFMAVDPVGRLLAVFAEDGVAIVDVRRAEPLVTLPVPKSYPLAFESNGAALWTYGREHGVLRWPVTRGRDDTMVRIGPPTVTSALRGGDQWGASRDLSVVAIPNYERGGILWRPRPSQSQTLMPQRDVRYAAVSADGKWVATGSHECNDPTGAATVWNAATGRKEVELPLSGLCRVGFSPDGKWLLTTSGGCRLWRVGSWEEGPQLPGGSGGFAFSSDGRLLALEGGPGEIRLVAVETGKILATLSTPDRSRVVPQAITPDGNTLIALGEESKALRFVDLRALREQLRELDLDWEETPVPARPATVGPIRVELDLGSLGAPPPTPAPLPEPPDAAMVRHTLALFANPLDAEARFRRGALLYGGRTAMRHDAAVPDLSVAILLRHPQAATAYHYRGHLHDVRRAWSAAAADFRAAIEGLPAERGHLAKCVGRSKLREGKPAEAADWFERALQEKPIPPEDEGEACWRLAWLRSFGPADLRDARRAVELARRATALRADDPDAFALGGALYRAGDEQGAVAALEKGLAVRGGGRAGFAFYLLALTRHHLGAAAQAAEAAERGREWQTRNEKSLFPDERADLAALRAEVDGALGTAKRPADRDVRDGP